MIGSDSRGGWRGSGECATATLPAMDMRNAAFGLRAPRVVLFIYVYRAAHGHSYPPDTRWISSTTAPRRTMSPRARCSLAQRRRPTSAHSADPLLPTAEPCDAASSRRARARASCGRAPRWPRRPCRARAERVDERRTYDGRRPDREHAHIAPVACLAGVRGAPPAVVHMCGGGEGKGAPSRVAVPCVRKRHACEAMSERSRRAVAPPACNQQRARSAPAGSSARVRLRLLPAHGGNENDGGCRVGTAAQPRGRCSRRRQAGKSCPAVSE